MQEVYSSEPFTHVRGSGRDGNAKWCIQFFIQFFIGYEKALHRVLDLRLRAAAHSLFQVIMRIICSRTVFSEIMFEKPLGGYNYSTRVESVGFK